MKKHVSEVLAGVALGACRLNGIQSITVECDGDYVLAVVDGCRTMIEFDSQYAAACLEQMKGYTIKVEPNE